MVTKSQTRRTEPRILFVGGSSTGADPSGAASDASDPDDVVSTDAPGRSAHCFADGTPGALTFATRDNVAE